MNKPKKTKLDPNAVKNLKAIRDEAQEAGRQAAEKYLNENGYRGSIN